MKKRRTRQSSKEATIAGSEQRAYENFLDWLTDSPISDQAADSGGRLGVFETASVDAVNRYGAIPLLTQEIDSLPASYGSLLFDSWAGAAPAMRDIVPGHLRRIQLKAGQTIIEIVAERQQGDWEFVARAYQGETVKHDFVLKIGRKRLLAKSGGFFHWNSKSVPKMIELITHKRNLVFEGLSW